MRIMAKVIAIAVALTALPALAIPLDDHDRVAQQGFTHRDSQEERAIREREQTKGSRPEAPCSCAHEMAHEKDAPKS